MTPIDKIKAAIAESEKIENAATDLANTSDESNALALIAKHKNRVANFHKLLSALALACDALERVEHQECSSAKCETTLVNKVTAGKALEAVAEKLK